MVNVYIQFGEKLFVQPNVYWLFCYLYSTERHASRFKPYPVCCYVIFIKYVLVTFTNKQRRIIFKFDALYVEQLSPSSFIYISKPFSFFFFSGLCQSFAKLLCRFLPYLLYFFPPIIYQCAHTDVVWGI